MRAEPSEESLGRTNAKQDAVCQNVHPLTREVDDLFAREAVEVNVPRDKGAVAHESVEALAVCGEEASAATRFTHEQSDVDDKQE